MEPVTGELGALVGRVLIVKALMGGVFETSSDTILVGGVSAVDMGAVLVGGVSVGEILFNDACSLSFLCFLLSLMTFLIR